MTKKLFIEPITQYRITDENGETYGIGATPDEAVRNAREITDDTIYKNKECEEIYDNISLADRQADELDNQIRDTLPDDDYFEMHEPGYHIDPMFGTIVYDDY